VLELVKKITAVFNTAEPQNGETRSVGPAEALRESYRQTSNLAEQINLHAEKAPYPHVAERLRQIAGEKRSNANRLREKILGLGGRLEEAPGDTKSAKNHWERMVRDLSDQKALENSLLERAALLVEQAPELAELLRDIVAAQRPHKETLLDLIARADPQAEQT